MSMQKRQKAEKGRDVIKMNKIELCLNCTAKKCIGTCEKIRGVRSKDPRRRKLTANGVTHTLAEWEKITGVSYKLMDQRIRRGKRGSEVIKPKRNYEREFDNGQLQTNS